MTAQEKMKTYCPKGDQQKLEDTAQFADFLLEKGRPNLKHAADVYEVGYFELLVYWTQTRCPELIPN